MKKLLFNSLACSALLFSTLFLTACGGGSSTDDTDSTATAENGLSQTITVPVVDNQFTGPLAGIIEIVDKDLNFKFEKSELSSDETKPYYEIRVPVTIKVIGECKLISMQKIPIDIINADGVVFETIKIDGWNDTFDKLENDIKNGVTGNAYKAEFIKTLKYEEAQTFAEEIKSTKGGLVEADVAGQKLASGALYVEDATFTGPFADIIKIKDGTYPVKIEKSVLKGRTNVEIRVDVEVLKQSSKQLDYLSIKFLNASGTTILSLYQDNVSTLNEMINNGNIGKSDLVYFHSMQVSDAVGEALKEGAIAISAGNTKSK